MSSNIFNDLTKKEIENIKNKNKGKKIGFTCSCFDLMHPGHMMMLKDANKNCDILIVGLQTDPTIDRPNKNKPILSYIERHIIVDAIRYIDEVINYATEDDLINILKELKPDIRVLGTDYLGKSFTGDDLPIDIYWHNRDHDYSTTNLRKAIFLEEKRLNRY